MTPLESALYNLGWCTRQTAQSADLNRIECAAVLAELDRRQETIDELARTAAALLNVEVVEEVETA